MNKGFRAIQESKVEEDFQGHKVIKADQDFLARKDSPYVSAVVCKVSIKLSFQSINSFVYKYYRENLEIRV